MDFRSHLLKSLSLDGVACLGGGGSIKKKKEKSFFLFFSLAGLDR